MRNINFSNGVIRIISGTAMALLLFVGATLAQTSNVDHKKTKGSVAHYTKVAGKDTARSAHRAAKKTVLFTKNAAKDTGTAVDKASTQTATTLERGGGAVEHDAKVAGKKTGRFFRRVGHAIY